MQRGTESIGKPQATVQGYYHHSIGRDEGLESPDPAEESKEEKGALRSAKSFDRGTP